MEVLPKVLHFVCLLSVAVCFEINPALDIKKPLNLLFSNVFPNKNNLDKSTPHEECFCIPTDTTSPPIINILNSEHTDNLERVVIYLYKSDGIIKVYIPNKHKQEVIPNLNFDENEGDILKVISSETVEEFFDTSSIVVQNSVGQLTEDTSSEDIYSETINEESYELHQAMETNEHEISVSEDYISPIPLDSDGEKGKPLDGPNNVPIDDTIAPKPQNEVVNNFEPELNQVTTLDNTENMISILTKPEKDNSIEGIDISQLQQGNSIPSKINPHLQLNKFDIINLHNILNSQSIPSKNVQQIFSPTKPPTYIESPIQQHQYLINQNYNRILTFHEWFADQLNRVVLYNLGTPSKILGLRDRIRKVLIDNGMRLDAKGYVIYSNGHLVQINNLHLRPILIGDHSESQILLEPQVNVKEPLVPYTQLIEIILAEPLTLLGTLVMGTVYLPRNVNVGCLSCRPNHPYPYINGLQEYSHINVPYGSYIGLPISKGYTNGQIVMQKLPPIEKPISQPAKQVGDTSDRTGIGGILDGLLANLGITTTPLIPEPNRRLLGGTKTIKAKPGPKMYPNDFLPGYRIIGGNAATSSGTPLVSKGRSGFVKPARII